MESGPDVPAAADNPAALADAEQHARQELAELRARSAWATRGAAIYIWPAVAGAAGLLSGWLIRRWRRKR